MGACYDSRPYAGHRHLFLVPRRLHSDRQESDAYNQQRHLRRLPRNHWLDAGQLRSRGHRGRLLQLSQRHGSGGQDAESHPDQRRLRRLPQHQTSGSPVFTVDHLQVIGTCDSCHDGVTPAASIRHISKAAIPVTTATPATPGVRRTLITSASSTIAAAVTTASRQAANHPRTY